ncbi:MAG: alpha-ketoglutarate-dependent dioxygenase AlkB [Pyrinomonadaceae bacterium]
MAVQNALLTILPQGVWHLRGFLPRAEQERLRDDLRDVVRAAPLFTPVKPYGSAFRYKVTNCGEFGWTSEEVAGYRFIRRHPKGQEWPPIPQSVLDAGARAALEAGFTHYSPNSCLLSFYEPGLGGNGPQRENTLGEDESVPVVMLGLGASCELGIGGLDFKDPLQHIDFNSGDALLLAGPGRGLYNEIRSVTAGCDLLANGGLLLTTLRYVMFDSRRRRG